MYTHRGAYLKSLGQSIETGLTGDSVYLWTAPMFHCNGWCFPWAVTAVAGTHVCLRKVDPDHIWDLIRRATASPTTTARPPSISVWSHTRRRTALERRVTVIVGGAPPSPTLLARLRDLNFRPIHIYGLTETYAPATICEWHREWGALPDDEQARLAGAPGRALPRRRPGARGRRGDARRPRDGQTMGEVVMRGNTVMKGYLRRPGGDRDRVSPAAGSTPATSAVMHPDGYIELRDRKKDIIISGGENISTIEVEQAIVRHPAVLECAVVAVPDEKWGERPKAFVTLKPGHGRRPRTEIIAFCREQHRPLQVPRRRRVRRAARRPRPARCRSSSCARGSGRGTKAHQLALSRAVSRSWCGRLCPASPGQRSASVRHVSPRC